MLDKSKNLSFDRHLNALPDINYKATSDAKSRPLKHVPVLEEQTTKHEQTPDTKIVIETIKLTEKQNQQKSAKEEKLKNESSENNSIKNKTQTNTRPKLLDDALYSHKDYIKLPRMTDTHTKNSQDSLIESKKKHRDHKRVKN